MGMAFDPAQLSAMGRAYEHAVSYLETQKVRPVPDREAVARYIVVVAERGETDPDQLCAMTLQWFMEPGVVLVRALWPSAAESPYS